MPTGTNTIPGHAVMSNMGGFDPSDLMAAPEIRQEQPRIRQTWLVLHMNKPIKWQLKKQIP